MRTVIHTRMHCITSCRGERVRRANSRGFGLQRHQSAHTLLEVVFRLWACSTQRHLNATYPARVPSKLPVVLANAPAKRVLCVYIGTMFMKSMSFQRAPPFAMPLYGHACSLQINGC